MAVTEQPPLPVQRRPRSALRRRVRRQRAAAVVGGVLLLAGGVVGAHALLQHGKVVNGVSVGGIDVGGDSAAAARARLAATLATRLDDPITVHASGISATVVPS